ncbi:MAG: hypothetical protein WBW80_19775, partial [Acidimicrobiales bacterium]
MRQGDQDGPTSVSLESDTLGATAREHEGTPVAVDQPMASHIGRRRDRLPLPIVLVACTVLLLVTMTLGVAIGSVPLSPRAVWQVIVDHLSGHPKTTVTD